MLRPLNEWDRVIIFDYLGRNEEEAAFIIGNALQWGITNRSNILRCGDYFGYFEGSCLKGVIAFYNLGTCISHYESAGAIPYFSQLMITRSFSIILGTDRIVRPLFEGIRHHKSLKELEECYYLVNYNFKPFKLEGAKFLNVFEDSDMSIISFVRKAYLRGFETERSIEETRTFLSQRNQEEDVIIICKDDKMLSQACVQTFTDNTNQIGAVYTLEEERGKGYAKAVVSELCERIISRRKLPTLIVNKCNEPAVNAYKVLGFEHRDDYIIIRFNI